jgi:serine/threonine-protein kinase
MATVYLGRATRDDGTEERVALKLIRDDLAHDEQFRAMFVDESKILAQLSHPNVIRTLACGLTGEHRFIAMELLSGRTLADLWERLALGGERLPPGLAAWICARIAEGLHSAHELKDDQGQLLSVIHRDVNPGNIFVTHAGEVKLIDFGLAKARLRVAKSAEGVVKGKIPYLAPEQAHGRAIDRRVDVYALGATLWEAVTSRRLFKRETDIDTLRAIRDAKIPDVRELVGGFPPGLWYIIEKALRADPDARHETADELRRELDGFIEEAGGDARMPESLAATLGRLFPGQEERQARWERDAVAVAVAGAANTMPPPAPVPGVPREPRDGTATAVREPSAGAASPTANEPGAGKAPRATGRASRRPGESEAARGAPPSHGAAETTAAGRPLWVTMVVLACVVLGLALALAARG